MKNDSTMIKAESRKRKSMEKPIIVSLGELLWDVLPNGKRAGGAPINFSYHASMNGADGYGISAVGNDALGDELVEAAREAGIKTIIQRNDWPTGTVDIVLADGVPEYKIAEDVAWDHIAYSDELADLVKRADAVCFGTLGLRSSDSRETIKRLLKESRTDAMRFFDVNMRDGYYSESLIKELLGYATVLKVNDDELILLKDMFDLNGSSDEDACLWLIRQYNLDFLIFTAGAQSSSIYTKDGEESTLPTPHVDVVDTVGAGDSFSGTFTAKTLLLTSLSEAHRAAVDVAAYVCCMDGAWPVYPKGLA